MNTADVNKKIASDSSITPQSKKGQALYENISTINILDEFKKILQSVINSFVCYTENNLPNYSAYVNNGYKLLGLMPETTISDAKYFIMNDTDLYTTPKFSDITSTSWYQINKYYIYYFNKLFNDCLISKAYYNENLGTLMIGMFDFFVNTMNGNRNKIYYYEKQNILDETPSLITSISDLSNNKSMTIIINGSVFGNPNLNNNFEERVIVKFNSGTYYTILKNHIVDFDLRKTQSYSETFDIPIDANSCEIYYINNPGYQVYLNIAVFINNSNLYYQKDLNNYTETILNSWNTQTLSIPPIDNNGGIDFYRLRNFEVVNEYTGKTKNVELSDFYNDNITVYNYNLKKYNDYSLILSMKNNANYFYYENSEIKNRKKADVFFEHSYKIFDYIEENLSIRYLENLGYSENYNTIQTHEFSELTKQHHLLDIYPSFSQDKTLITNTDKIGFGFNFPNVSSTQDDFGFGFYIGIYPNIKSIVQIKKLGSDYYLFITHEGTETNIKLNFSLSNISKCFFFVDINNLFLFIDDKSVNISSITIQANLLNNIDKISLFINNKIQVQVLDLYSARNSINGYIDNTNIKPHFDSSTVWLYAGIIDILHIINNNISTKKQLLHTVYYVNNSNYFNEFDNHINIIQDSTDKSLSINYNDKHPFGLLTNTINITNSTDLVGFSFRYLENIVSDSQIGIFGRNSDHYKMYINSNENFVIEFNNLQCKFNTEFNLDTGNNDNYIYYFFYTNTKPSDIQHSNDVKITIFKYNISTQIPTKLEITHSEIYDKFNSSVEINKFYDLLQINQSLYAFGTISVRFYTDRYAYLNCNNYASIITLMEDAKIWFYIGGINTIPYDEKIKNIKNIKMSLIVNNYNISNNTYESYEQTTNKYDYNDIAFSYSHTQSVINLMTFGIEQSNIIYNDDIVGFSFSINNAVSDDFGIGIGTDGYSSEKYLTIGKKTDNSQIKKCLIINDGTGEKIIYFEDERFNISSTALKYNEPIFDSTNIYYCFQNNQNGTFTVYEDNCNCPVITLDIANVATGDEKYDTANNSYSNLLEIFKNNAHLYISGSCDIKFFTAKYSYLNTSNASVINDMIKSTTKWLYIGGKDISIFDSNNDSNNDINNITNLLHNSYKDGNDTYILDTYVKLTKNIDDMTNLLNPVKFFNTYNTNGIHGKETNINNKSQYINHNTSIYNVMDSIYNNRLTGNICSTFNLLNLELPVGKIYSDFISNDVNPFYSYCMYESFLNSSSIVNYDNNVIKKASDIEDSKLLNFGDCQEMFNIFNDVVYKDLEINHALENTIYSKFTYGLNKNLFIISNTDIDITNINTLSYNEHIFYKKTSSNSLEGIQIIPQTKGQVYGFSFTVNNISEINSSESIEIGVIINDNIGKKIVIRKIGLNYDLYLQNEDFKQNFSISQTINFNSTNIFYVLIYVSDDSNEQNIQIYQNFTLVSNENFNNYLNNTKTQSCNFKDLFLANAGSYKVNLFINGNINISYYSYHKSLLNANNVIGDEINKTNNINWLFPTQDTEKLNTFSYHKNIIFEKFENDYNTIMLKTNNYFDNYSLENTVLTNENDIVCCAFELLEEPTNFSIGFGNDKNFMQIKKNNDIYDLYINSTSITNGLANIFFKPAYTYLLIQNNKNKTFSIYKYNDGSIIQVYKLTNENKSYENIIDVISSKTKI
jgi:hypothetical protein